MGMLILIEEIISHLTDAQPFEFPNPLLYDAFEFGDGEFILRHDYLLLAAMALAVVGMLYYLIFHTRLGLATRAISQQPVAAQLCGARIDRVNEMVFILSAGIAGATGFMVAMTIGTIIPGLASVMTIKGLVVAVFGGLGSVPGAVIAGLILGMLEAETSYLFNATIRDIVAYLVLFAVLVVRPAGLLGKRSLYQ
jgi:branched-subunit amino acid ABC-type transport system permease component